MPNTNHLNCPIHGDYQKFKNDPNQNCPHCEKLKIETEQSIPIIKSLLKTKFVQVGCEEHGFKQIEVPESIEFNTLCYECERNKNEKLFSTAKQSRIDEEYRKASLPANTLGMGFNKLDQTQSERQGIICQALTAMIMTILDKGDAISAKNILFTGGMGTGKTLMMSIFLQNIIKRSFKNQSSLDPNDLSINNRLRCFFITEAQIIQTIKESWNKESKESYKRFIHKLSTVPILAIDDVGSIESSSHLFEMYTSVIDERYKRRLPILMTSNVTHEEIHKIIGTRPTDRLLESERALVIRCDWQSYRRRNGLSVI